MTNLTIVIRLVLTMILSGLVGLDRQLKSAAAGLRTNMLVGLGGCLAGLLGIYLLNEFGFKDAGQITRIAQGVITGISFLGAGCIISLANTRKVIGLTSAATIWTTAILGLCVGLGFYFASIVATILIVFILFVLKFVEKKWLIREDD